MSFDMYREYCTEHQMPCLWLSWWRHAAFESCNFRVSVSVISCAPFPFFRCLLKLNLDPLFSCKSVYLKHPSNHPQRTIGSMYAIYIYISIYLYIIYGAPWIRHGIQNQGPAWKRRSASCSRMGHPCSCAQPLEPLGPLPGFWPWAPGSCASPGALEEIGSRLMTYWILLLRFT